MKVLTVSEVSEGIKLILEANFEFVKVKGEVSQAKRHTSGNLYFAIKDRSCVLDCVAWRSNKLSFEPKDGDEVVCSGKITSYQGRSKYQLNVLNVEHAGLGAIMQAIEERKKRLAAEGLFDPDRKPKVPRFPKHIGIATSSTGAVIHDMLHRLKDRYPTSVTLYPIPVQGPEVAKSAIDAINYFIRKEVNVIILARGGGSFEDLLGFYDEDLTRSVATSTVPIVTAIGHETDTTLVDYASSLRAPTPTAAIELITPNRTVIVDFINNLVKQSAHHMSTLIKNSSLLCAKSSRFEIESFMVLISQRLDYTLLDFSRSIDNYLNTFRNIITRIDPPSMSEKYVKLFRSIREATTSIRNQIHLSEACLHNLSQLLHVLSYKTTLDRGFCRAFLPGSGSVRNKKQAIELGQFIVEFNDGQVEVQVIPKS